jgi:arabinogalactan oligomer/maltooligosaccharide transport system permease protein
LIRRKEKAKGERSDHFIDLRRALPWLIPGVVVFAIMTLIPLFFEFGTSLTNLSSASMKDGLHGGIMRAIWEGLTGKIPVSQITGRGNQVQYTGLTAYPYLLNYISGSGLLFFNIMWTFLSVLLQTGLGLAVALLVWQKGIRFGKFWQTLFILPWAIPEYIGALMWFNIFAPEVGWLALAVNKFGSSTPLGFFTGWERSTNLWLIVLLIPAVWYGFPFLMLSASAGLKMIPYDVFDAAAIDGANGWQTLRSITWPLLVPLVVPAIIVRCIFAFNQFYLFRAFFVFDYGSLANVSYDLFYNSQYAISATINIVTLLILIGFVVILNRWTRASEGVNYA